MRSKFAQSQKRKCCHVISFSFYNLDCDFSNTASNARCDIPPFSHFHGTSGDSKFTTILCPLNFVIPIEHTGYRYITFWRRTTESTKQRIRLHQKPSISFARYNKDSHFWFWCLVLKHQCIYVKTWHPIKFDVRYFQWFVSMTNNCTLLNIFDPICDYFSLFAQGSSARSSFFNFKSIS